MTNIRASELRVRIAAALLLWFAVLALGGVRPASSRAAEAPIKEILSSRFGWNVNKTEQEASAPQSERDLCTVASGDECQPGAQSMESEGFGFPGSVAVDRGSDVVYVADRNNNRVQEFSGAGELTAMFGWDVNATKDGNATATQAEKNVCTVVSHEVCKAGVAGDSPGQIGGATGIAVDPSSGDLYVAEVIAGESNGSLAVGYRVQKLTPEGRFVLEIGGKVNGKTGGNLCTQAEVENEGVTCEAPSERAPGPVEGAQEAGEFTFAEERGNVVAAGGPHDILYVGDEHRVQEFTADGEPAGEIPLTALSAEPGSRVTAAAVDAEGDLYLVYQVNFVANTIYEFGPTGEMLSQITPTSRVEGGTISITGLAVDSSKRIFVSEAEGFPVGGFKFEMTGSLRESGTGHVISEFSFPEAEEIQSSGLALAGNDDLYATRAGGQDILAYTPVPVAEVATLEVACSVGSDSGASATFQCTLEGDVNPEGVSGTEAWFEWGRTPVFGFETSREPVSTGSVPIPINAPISEGLEPNETYYYRVLAQDENMRPPEVLSTARASFTTPTAPPRIVGLPSIGFTTSSSAVMFGELNPENARTEGFFEYGSGEALAKCPGGTRHESCLGVTSTSGAETGVYGTVGVTLEAKGLQPATLYRYRLSAESENRAKTAKEGGKGSEGEFTTGQAPAVQAETGPVGSLAGTGAVVSGSVNPDGRPATYRFELGVYEGSSTQYGTVSSGSVGAGSTLVEETLALSGLQPGTTYAYRIAVESGYGSATGATRTFTTAGLAETLFSPSPTPLLGAPQITFPKPESSCKHGYRRDKGGRCIKVKKKVVKTKRGTKPKKKVKR